SPGGATAPLAASDRAGFAPGDVNPTMAARRKKERIAGTYFTWLLGRRGGVFYADGRPNRPPAGRHSLATRDHAQALTALRHLDLVRAVDLGLADRSSLA